MLDVRPGGSPGRSRTRDARRPGRRRRESQRRPRAARPGRWAATASLGSGGSSLSRGLRRPCLGAAHELATGREVTLTGSLWCRDPKTAGRLPRGRAPPRGRTGVPGLGDCGELRYEGLLPPFVIRVKKPHCRHDVELCCVALLCDASRSADAGGRPGAVWRRPTAYTGLT